jgi:hypothetical protein
LLGEDAELLKREIQAIKELLEEEAGSKCEWILSGYDVLIIRAKGCMESLVHYQTLLIRRHYAVLGDEECERLRAASLDLLQQLEVLDPLRSRDIEISVSTASITNLITLFAKKLGLFTCFSLSQHRPFHQINDVDYHLFCSLHTITIVGQARVPTYINTCIRLACTGS